MDNYCTFRVTRSSLRVRAGCKKEDWDEVCASHSGPMDRPKVAFTNAIGTRGRMGPTVYTICSLAVDGGIAGECQVATACVPDEAKHSVAGQLVRTGIKRV